jgi:hypothetical protein
MYAGKYMYARGEMYVEKKCVRSGKYVRWKIYVCNTKKKCTQRKNM